VGVLTRSLQTFRKGLTFSPMNGQSWNYYHSGLSNERGYSGDVGDGSSSSLVEACISFIANAASQTHPAVMHYDPADDLGELDRAHPAARLMRHPTYDARNQRSYYSWIPLIQATLTSFTISGNAYWRKVRSGSGLPVQLWYIPHWMVTPHRRDFSSYFIDYYRIRYGAQEDIVSPRDLIHFRDSLDPLNPMLGISKLRTLLREIFTDEEAARWTASLLRNQGVPGIIVSPDTGAAAPTEDDAKLIKARLMEDFTGDRRGEPMVLGAPTKIQQYGFSPEQMKLGELRDIPEERVSAVLGIPAAVAGLGAGLSTAKVGATMGELVDLAWQNGVLPRTRLLAAELTEQLLPDFGFEQDMEFIFDTSRVPIMADYQNKVAEKHERLLRSNIEMRSEARRAVGLKAGKDDEVFTLMAGVTIIEPDGTLVSGKDVALANEPLAPAPAGATVTLVPPPPQAALPAPAPKALTPREQKVVALVGQGLTTRAIAEEIEVSDRTIERTISTLMEKADVESRGELVAWLVDQKSALEPTPSADVADAIAGAQAALEDMRAQIAQAGAKTDPAVLQWMERSEANVLRVIEGQGALLVEVAKALGNKPAVTTVMEVERDANGRVLRSVTRPETVN